LAQRGQVLTSPLPIPLDDNNQIRPFRGVKHVCGSRAGERARGPASTVCNIANFFCFIENDKASLTEVAALMQRWLAGASHDLV
jgi:hypothetical protein